MEKFGYTFLLRKIEDCIRLYSVSAILAFILVLLIPSLIRWCLFYVGGIVFISSLIAPFIRDWKPRKRVNSNGKAVFITGCDSGFGNELARRLDSLDLHVFAGCLFPNGEGAEELKKSSSSRLHIVPLDVTSDDSVQEAKEYIDSHLEDNKLWAIVNNAGINAGGEVIWTNTNIMEKIFDVNTYGVLRVTKAFLPMLCKSKGRVVTTTSFVSRYTALGIVPYCMSKQATQRFCDGLRLEMYRFGVQVITIEPTGHNTNFMDTERVFNYINEAWEEAPLEVKEIMLDDCLEQAKHIAMNFMTWSVTYNLKETIDQFEEAVMAVNPRYSYNPGTLFPRFCLWFLIRLPKPITDFLMIKTLTR